MTFHSARRAARRPFYVFDVSARPTEVAEPTMHVFVPIENATPVPPLVPPLPEHGYCDTLVALPV